MMFSHGEGMFVLFVVETQKAAHKVWQFLLHIAKSQHLDSAHLSFDLRTLGHLGKLEIKKLADSYASEAWGSCASASASEGGGRDISSTVHDSL